MKKLIYLSFLLTLLSCGQSIVSSRSAVVISIEICNQKENDEKYIVCARYLDKPVTVYSFVDGRSESKGFILYTDTEYHIGDTIKLGQ